MYDFLCIFGRQRPYGKNECISPTNYMCAIYTSISVSLHGRVLCKHKYSIGTVVQ